MLRALNTSTNLRFIFKCIRERNNFFTFHYLNNYYDTEQLVDENGDSILINIIKHGSREMISYILSVRFRTTIDVLDHEGIHLLFHVARRSDLDLELTRSIFMRSNSNFDMTHPVMGSLLNQCIASKNLRAISVMMNCGIDVNALDENSDPVIFRCVTHGLLEISNLIISDPSFDVNRTNSFDESILEVALLKNMLIHASIIIKKLPKDVYSRNQSLKLMEICIDKKNTMMAWKIYQTYAAIMIQKIFRGFSCRRNSRDMPQE